MKSSIKKTTFKAIYRLLDRFTPINTDCGLLCGAACCTCEDSSNDCNFNDYSSSSDISSDFEMGIYLLPGEEKIFTRNEDWLEWGSMRAEDYEFPESWRGKVNFLKCRTAPYCDRKMRPIQCRTFPLAPHMDDDGNLCMIYQSAQLPYTCPLIADRIPLNDDFIIATYTVWTHLIRDPLIYDLVKMDSYYRIEDGDEIEIIYP